MRPQRVSRAMSTMGVKVHWMPAARRLRRQLLRLLLDRRIPRRCHGQRHRENGAVAVDHVEAEKDGDVQARLVHCDVLETVDLVRINEP